MKEKKALEDQVLVAREIDDTSALLGMMFHEKCDRQKWGHVGNGAFALHDLGQMLEDTYFTFLQKTLYDQFGGRGTTPFRIVPELTFMSAVCIPGKSDFIGPFRQADQNLDFERKILTCLYNVNIDANFISQESLQFSADSDSDDEGIYEINDAPAQATLFPSHIFHRPKVNTGDNGCNLFRITLQMGLFTEKVDYERLFPKDHGTKTQKKGVSAC